MHAQSRTYNPKTIQWLCTDPTTGPSQNKGSVPPMAMLMVYIEIY